jgi:hypothetical protein
VIWSSTAANSSPPSTTRRAPMPDPIGLVRETRLRQHHIPEPARPTHNRIVGRRGRDLSKCHYRHSPCPRPSPPLS